MDIIHVRQLGKADEGVECSLQATKPEWRGSALCLRNDSRGLLLTSSTAPPVTTLCDVSLTLALGEVWRVPPHSTAGYAQMFRALSGVL